MLNRNQNPYLYECQFPTASYCCPCIYYIHETPDMSLDFNPNNISQPLLIPKKEKAIFNNYKEDTKNQYKSSKKNKKITNSRYIDNNIINDYFSRTSIEMNQNRSIDIEPENKSNIKSNNYKYVNKNFTDNIEDGIDDYIVFKKLKIYNHKKDKLERQFSGTNHPEKKQKEKKKIKKIDINNCAPIIPNKKIKPKYFNKFELNKNNSEKLNKISINQKSVDEFKKYNIRKLNLTENLDDEFNLDSNYLIGNKFTMSDLNDDILENKQNYIKEENSENKISLENMKKEIDKANSIIDNLKIENNNLKARKKENEQINLLRKENKKLKKLIYGKDQNLEIKINKSTNTPIYNEKERDENEKNQKAKFEKEVNNLKNKILEIKNKLNEYEKFISILEKTNKELENIIKNKDKEIQKLNDKIGFLEKKNKNILNELNIKSDEILKESIDFSSDLKISNDSLKLEIEKLKEIIINKNIQIKELEIKLKYVQKFDSKMQKLLDMLFNFYLNIKKVINFDKMKESLKNMIEKVSLEEFQIKLNRVEKKFIQIIDDIQIRYGHCLACDIACCTSHVDKLKTFRKVNPKKK